MEETQSFRLLGSMDIEEILCDQVDGQNIVYWEDIEQAFPGVQKVKNGRVIISMMRDSNRIRIEPHCIKHYPGIVLDVLVSSDASQVHVGSPMATPSLAPDHARPADSPATNHPINPPAYAPTISPPPANPRIAVPVSIQRQPNATLGKPNQFYEQPFPRLPIILPMAVHRVGDIVKPSPRHFKLYFLCECEAYKSKEGLMETARAHLADHAGYNISRPMGLFKEFGTYILAVMRAVQADIPSMTVAPLASSAVLQELNRVEDETQESISSLFAMAIGYLEGLITSHEDADLHGIPNPFVFDGDDRLYQHKGPLSFYLDSKDQTLGNLYRSVTKDSDVHWVCRAHFQQNHDNESARRLREVIEENQGSLVDETGTVDIKLANETKATVFFDVLSQVQSVQELAVSFTWNAPQSTLQSLANAILQSNVVSFVFTDFHYEPSPINPNTQRRFDPLIQLFAIGKIQLVRLPVPGGFFQQVSNLSAQTSFPTIRKLWSLQISDGRQFGLFHAMIKRCTALQRIMISLPEHQALPRAIQCIAACPTLEEFYISWDTSDFSAVFSLMDHVKPLLTSQQLLSEGSQSSLRHLKIHMQEQTITAKRSEKGEMLVSTTSSTPAFLRPLLTRFGWAVKDVCFHQVLVNDYFDLRPWVHSIENNGGASNLRSLTLNEFQLTPAMRLPLLEIIERSQGLETLLLRLNRVTEDPSATNVTWSLGYLGPHVTALELRPRGGRIHPRIASQLGRGGLLRLRDIQVFNQGKDNNDIRWLINLLTMHTRSRICQEQAFKWDAQALTRLTVNGIYVQIAEWKLLFEALDFTRLTYVDLSNCSIRPPQLFLLLIRLPDDGLLQDGYPVPLTYLNIGSFPTEKAVEAQKEALKREVAKRAPSAKLVT